MTPLLWAACAVCMALMAWSAWSVYAVWVEVRALRNQIAALLANDDKKTTHLRAVRLQIANIIGMLFRAGFKRGPTTLDWNDDANETQILGQDDARWKWPDRRQ